MKRLNWIDILVIIILVGAVAFVGAVLLGRRNTGEAEEMGSLSQPTLEFVVEIPDITRELAENAIATFDDAPINVGGVLTPTTRIYNNSKVTEAEIVSWDIKDTEEEGLVSVRLTIKAAPTLFSGNYVVGTQEIRLGKSDFIVKTMRIEFQGTIISMTELGNE